MSDINQNNNLGPSPRPARSRFNFSNTRFDAPQHEHIEEREPVAKARKLRPGEKGGPLIFNVSQLLRDPEGSTRTYDYEQDVLTLNEDIGEDIAGSEATNVQGDVRLTKVRHDILAQGPGEADVVLNCVRCLNDYTQHIEYEIEDIFRPSIDVLTGLPVKPEVPEDEADLRIDQNHLIDLGEAIRQQILVSLPMQPICGDDCPGLYQYLEEINKDVTEEADEEAPADPRWSALSKLRLDE
jgi:uncharacterized protein